jgi:hypothetical protein
MRLGRWEETDLEGDAGFVATIDGEVEGIVPGLVELELLDIDDEIARQEIAIGGEAHIGGQFDAGHDGTTVFVDEVHAHAVLAFLDAAEDQAEGNGALGMNGWELVGDDGIEGAEEIEFTAVIGGGVAKHGDLNIHKASFSRRCWAPARCQEKLNGV